MSEAADDRPPSPDEWAEITEQFDRLEPMSPKERDRAIAASTTSPFVRARVRSLLASSETVGILDHAIDWSPPDPAAGYASLAPGTIVGQFRIERLIGRGGAGEVYLAGRADGGFAQRAAIKLLRPEAVGRMASFDTERALLATLEHPGIARLIDGGTARDGRPYMALEYVEGEPITMWCEAHHADVRRRLSLFVEVCDAVAYAHARLIVHRDLKPSNILIDDDGRPRLLDFGIAKLVDESGGPGETRHTAILTPEYAAPEQLENGVTTVATDVHALGTLLFELLVGHRPWDGGAARLPVMLRRILDEEPPIPSRAAQASGGSPIPPMRIAGDLDAIILKAMRRVPDQRYATVGELADDVRRHLALRPVEARAGSTLYHTRRFVRRYRWSVAGAVAALLAILIGAAGIAWQARQTAQERDAARAEAAALEARNRAMEFIFRDASINDQRSMTVREMIDSATRRITQSLPPDSPDAALTINALADLYIILEGNEDAKAILAGALRRGIARNDIVSTSGFKERLGRLLVLDGNFPAARRLLSDADHVWRTDPVRFRRERVETTDAYARILRLQNRREEALALLKANMTDADATYRNSDRDLADRYANITLLLLEMGRTAEAKAILSRGWSLMFRPGRPPSSDALTLPRMYADASIRDGDYGVAEAIFKQIIAQRRRYYGPSVALSVDLLRYARFLNQRGRHADALTLLAEAAPMADDHFGQSSSLSAQIRYAQVEALALLGQTGKARAIFTTLATYNGSNGNPNLPTARFLRSRAALELAEGHAAAAAATLTAAYALVQPPAANQSFFRAESEDLRRRIAAARTP